jgi:hypothetical protein
MLDLEALMVLEVPELEAQLASLVLGGRVLTAVSPAGYHTVAAFGPRSEYPAYEGYGLDPRLALLDTIRKAVQLPDPSPNWNPHTRKDPRSYLSSVTLRANVPDPDDLDPEVLKKAFTK